MRLKEANLTYYRKITQMPSLTSSGVNPVNNFLVHFSVVALLSNSMARSSVIDPSIAVETQINIGFFHYTREKRSMQDLE